MLKYLHKKYYINIIIPDGPRKFEYIELSDEFLIIPNELFPYTKFNLKGYIRFVIVSIYKLYLIFKYLKKKEIDLCFLNSSVCFVEVIPIIFFKIPYLLSIKEKINPFLIRKLIYKFYYYTAKKITTISKFLKNEFIKITKYQDIRIIYSAIDKDTYEYFRKQSYRKLRKSSRFNIINIGAIYPLKGQNVLVDATRYIENLKDIEIKMIGRKIGGKYYQDLNVKIDQIMNECNIILVGELKKEEMITELLKSDCLVITSKEEGLSIVLLEGLFFGIPVITTNVGLVPEIIKDYENGIIYEYGNPKMLAEKIEELRDNKELYEKLKANARKTYDKYFNLQRSLKTYENELLKLSN